MKSNRSLWAAVLLLAGTVFNSCATATVSRTVTVQPITPGTPGMSNAFLFGGGGVDWVRTILCEPDGSCGLFGYSNKSFSESTDFLVAIQSPQGVLAWARTYGGTHRDVLRTAARVSGGGYLLVGTSQSLFFTAMKVISPSRPPRPILMTIDASGNPRWVKTFDSGGVVEFLAAVQTTDDGHVLVGYGSAGPAPGVVAVKVSHDGTVLWAYRYDIDEQAFGMAAVPTRDGGVAISGHTATSDGRDPAKPFVMKIDAKGAVVWAKLYDADGRQGIFSLTEAVDLGFVIAGEAWDASGAQSVFAMKLSSTGSPMWARSFGAFKSGQAMSVVSGHGGDIVIVGRMENGPHGGYDGLTLLLAADGSAKAGTIVGGSGNDELMSVVPWGANQYRLVGDTESFGAMAIDILSVVWSPDSGDRSIGAARDFAGQALPTQAREVHVTAVPLSPGVTTVPVSLLELALLTVPASR